MLVSRRAVSSVGRAHRLHRWGRRFESVTAHQSLLAKRARLPRRSPTGEGGLCIRELRLGKPQETTPASGVSFVPRVRFPAKNLSTLQPPWGTSDATMVKVAKGAAVA